MSKSSEISQLAKIEGICGAAGFAIGRALVIESGRLGVIHRNVAPEKKDREFARFVKATADATAELRLVAQEVKSRSAQNSALGVELSILDAYLMMLSDETLRSAVEEQIRQESHCAEWALELSVEAMCKVLRDSGNPYLAERSHDFEFIRDRILRALTGQKSGLVLPKDGEPVILVAHDLSPAETATLSKDRILGVVTEVGTRTSHTAILARALEIPAVVGVTGALESIGNGDQLVVDALHGMVYVEPSAGLLEQLEPQAERYYQVARGLREHRHEPTQTRDGVGLELHANIELPAEADIALDHGAKGIGLRG